MPEQGPVAPLVGALRALVTWLEANGVPGLIIGGVAASLLGKPRVTHDVDAVILLPPERWQATLRDARRFGLYPRLPHALEFARRSRVFLLRHRDSAIDVDVAIGALDFEEEAIRRASLVELGGVRIPLPAPEDLVIMKAVAHRARDLLDIESLLEVHAEIDVARVRRWTRAFATALDDSEIVKQIERILDKRKKRERRRGTPAASRPSRRRRKR